MVRSKPQRASKLLLDLEECIDDSAFNNKWKRQRGDFILLVNIVKTRAGMTILYKQLRILERFLSRDVFSDDWSYWKRAYWLFMTDPELDANLSITRFIVSLKFLQEELKPCAFCYSWENEEKQEWLQGSDALVYPLSRIIFDQEMIKNTDILMKLYGHSSFSEHREKNYQAISDIRNAANLLESYTKRASVGCMLGGAMRIIGGTGGLVITLAPATGGLSIAVPIICVSLGAGGLITSKVSRNRQENKEKETFRVIEEKTLKISPETLALCELLKNLALDNEAEPAMAHNPDKRALPSYKYENTILATASGVISTVALSDTSLSLLEQCSTLSSIQFSVRAVNSGMKDLLSAAQNLQNGSDLATKIHQFADLLESHITTYYNAYDEVQNSNGCYLESIASEASGFSDAEGDSIESVLRC